MPDDFTNIRVDKSNNNVFYGMIHDERITGTYFDDGRIVFEYSNDGTIGAPNKVFSGVYDDGLIYGMTAFNYEIEGVDKACVLTYVLSKDPANDVKLKALPNIKGDWKLSESYILLETGLDRYDEGTLSVKNEAENGLFECTLTNKKGNTESESTLYGMFLNTPLHGKYYGYLIDPVNKQTWDITFDGDALVAQTVLKSSTTSLSAVSCTFTSDGDAVETKFPQVKKDVYYSEKSMWACLPNGVGTIVKSNTPFMVNVVKQVGPCFLGTVIIDGISLVSAGTVNVDGHFTICCLMGPVTDFAYGVYVNDNMEVCANIYTEYLGRCSRYVDLATMPENKFIEDTDGLIGSWTVSSYASPSGETRPYSRRVSTRYRSTSNPWKTVSSEDTCLIPNSSEHMGRHPQATAPYG